MKQRLTGLAVTVTAAGVVGLVGLAQPAGAGSAQLASAGSASESAAASGPASACAVKWGSHAKRAVSKGASGSASLTNVRAGRHACFDRLVLNIARSGEARVRYVRAVPYEGRDGYIPLRGGAFLEIITGPSYDVNTGKSTYSPKNPRELVNVSGYRTFRQAATGGSFEGQTTLGLGVRSRLPFRVLPVSGPGKGSRIVIDVAHTW